MWYVLFFIPITFMNMKRGKFLSALLPSFAIVPAVAQTETEKPNIVVIVADDMGTNEIGCYGGANISTPNIDRLAGEGMMFTNNYTSMAMSVPIRAGSLAKYPAANRMNPSLASSEGWMVKEPNPIQRVAP